MNYLLIYIDSYLSISNITEGFTYKNSIFYYSLLLDLEFLNECELALQLPDFISLYPIFGYIIIGLSLLILFMATPLTGAFNLAHTAYARTTQNNNNNRPTVDLAWAVIPFGWVVGRCNALVYDRNDYSGRNLSQISDQLPCTQQQAWIIQGNTRVLVWGLLYEKRNVSIDNDVPVEFNLGNLPISAALAQMNLVSKSEPLVTPEDSSNREVKWVYPQ